jgi:hypothetical protein
MTITANLADGRVLNFPDGTDPQVIQATVKRMIRPKQEVQTTPDQPKPSFGDQAVGVAENIGSFASSIVAEPIAGIAGVVQSMNPFAEGGAGAEAVESVRNTLTYKPQTETGQQQQQDIGEALAPVGEALSEAEKFLGDNTLELTGSPALASIAHTLPTAALELIGLKGSRQLSAVKPPNSRLIRKTLIESAPEIETVKNASRSIFNELDSSGVSVNQKALNRLKANLAFTAKKEGIDIRVTPEAAGAIDAVNEAINKGSSVPTSEMDTLRTIAKNSIVSTDANKMRVGSAVVDEIDSFLDDIKSVDIDKGAQISASEVGKKYRTARKLWGRAKRAEMLQDAIETGSSRKAGMEKGIRNELNNLLNRKKSRKFLGPEDVAAIRKVTDGDFSQNFASLVGGMGLKFENSPSMFSSIIGGGGLGAVASQVPGLTGAAAPIAIGAITVGTISKEIAKKITKNKAQFLKTIATSGNDAERIAKAYLSAVPKAKRKLGDLSDLLLDPNLDLTVLDNVANETVKDAVKAAQFKREMLQAVSTIPTGAALSSLSEDEKADNER